MTQRQEQVGKLFKIEISDIILREMRDPRLGFVTITDVKVSPDLKYARVFLSIMGDKQQQETGLAALKHASRFVRGELGKRINMRVTPEIEFKIDESIEQGARIFELLQQNKHDEPDEG